MHALNVPSVVLVAISLFHAPTANCADEIKSPNPDIGFELGSALYFPAQKPAEKGHGLFFALEASVGPVLAGYSFEQLDMILSADDNNNGQAVDVRVQGQIHEMRVIKPIYDVVGLGLGFGVADLRGVIEANPNAPAQTGTMFADLAPVMDIFARFALLQGGQRMHSAINVVMGYRFVVLRSIDPDGSNGAGQIGRSYQNDINSLNGLRLGMSISVSF